MLLIIFDNHKHLLFDFLKKAVCYYSYKIIIIIFYKTTFLSQETCSSTLCQQRAEEICRGLGNFRRTGACVFSCIC